MFRVVKKYLADFMLAVAAVVDHCLTALFEYRKSAIEDYVKNSHSYSNHVTHIINFFYEYRILISVFIIVFALIWKMYESHENNNKEKFSIKSYLDRVHKRYFCKDIGVADPRMRITFFVPKIVFPFVSIKKGKIGILRKLVMEVRSGELYQESDVKIEMNRIKHEIKGNANKSSRIIETWDGVVGEAWNTGILVPVEGLPDYRTSNKTQKKEYVKKSNLIHKSSLEFDKFSMRPISIVGIAIRDIQSNKIGVLVIESMENKIFDYSANCNSGIAGRVFTKVVFNDIVENVQCIRG